MQDKWYNAAGRDDHYMSFRLRESRQTEGNFTPCRFAEEEHPNMAACPVKHSRDMEIRNS